MERTRLRRLEVDGDEHESDVLRKSEVEWLAKDTRVSDLANQEFELDMELLQSIINEHDPYPQIDEYIKTELVMHEELIDNMSDSATNCKQDVLADHQLVQADSADMKSEAGDSPKRLRNVKVPMLTKHFTPGAQTGDNASINSNNLSTFICEECGSSFTRKEHLKTHMLYKHNSINSNQRLNFTCEECGSSYTHQGHLHSHMLRKHLGKTNARFECEICSRSYRTKFYLNVHLRSHSKDRRREFACDLCEKTFYEKGNLTRHKKIHTGDLKPCKVCGRRFTTIQSLKTHMVVRRHFEKPQQLTPQSEPLKTEVNSDEEFIGEGNGIESVCYTEGTRQKALAGGNKQQNGVNTAMGSATCEVCHNIYPSELIKAHMRVTHNNKCEFCSRSCTSKSALKKHLRMHTKDRSREFVCDLCGKTFNRKNHLNRHKKTHARDLYPCKVCGQRFTQKETLKRHILRLQHFDETLQFTPQSSNNDVASKKTEELPDDEFVYVGNGNESGSHDEGTQQAALGVDNKHQIGLDTAGPSVIREVCHNSSPGELMKAHMRLTHSTKAYKCKFCSRSFKTKGHLKGHLRLHSKDRRREFACNLCGRAFYCKNILASHKKIHTGDRYPCKVCGHRFTRKEGLKRHMIRRQHFDKTQQFTPQTSNNDVASIKTELTSDEEFIGEGNGSESVSHTQGTQQPALGGANNEQTGVNLAVDSVTCEVCHNNYPAELIKVHMRLTHNNETYECKFCSRSYTTKSELKRHLRTHSKDRRREFTCDLCEKTFYEKKNLNMHKKLHTSDGYLCKVCGHHFTTKSNLKAHMVRSQHFDDKTPQVTLQSFNNDVACVKAGEIPDEKFIDEGNSSEKVSHAEETQQPALAGDNKQRPELTQPGTVGPAKSATKASREN